MRFPKKTTFKKICAKVQYFCVPKLQKVAQQFRDLHTHPKCLQSTSLLYLAYIFFCAYKFYFKQTIFYVFLHSSNLRSFPTVIINKRFKSELSTLFLFNCTFRSPKVIFSINWHRNSSTNLKLLGTPSSRVKTFF